MNETIFDITFRKVCEIRNFRYFHFEYDGPKEGYGFHNPNDEYVRIQNSDLVLNCSKMTTYCNLLDGIYSFPDLYGNKRKLQHFDYTFEMEFSIKSVKSYLGSNIVNIKDAFCISTYKQTDSDIVLNNLEEEQYYKLKVKFRLGEEGYVEYEVSKDNELHFKEIVNIDMIDVGFLNLGDKNCETKYKMLKLTYNKVNIQYVQ